MNYAEFLEEKTQLGGEYGFDPVWMPEFLFDFQRSLVAWSLRKGKSAIFADCGMGKTPMQLVWAENVVRRENKPVLIVTPLDSRDDAWLRVSGQRSEVGSVANSDGRNTSTEGLQRSGEHGQRAEDGRDVPVARGPVNGFWGRSDWVLTRPQRVGDRPGLRPVERGAFPLAHGTPARVGRLRGYGDGIVAQAAQAFIEAYLQVEDNSLQTHRTE